MSAAHRAFTVEIGELIQGLPLAHVRRVLDVPSGDGFYGAMLARRLPVGGMVVTADLDIDALNVAKRRANLPTSKTTLLPHAANILSLPFENDSFDMVWCAQSLISFSGPDERRFGADNRGAFQELYRVLRPGETIVLLEEDAMHVASLARGSGTRPP